MTRCDEGHPAVYFDGCRCPVCTIQVIANMESTRLRDRVDELETITLTLQTTIDQMVENGANL